MTLRQPERTPCITRGRLSGFELQVLDISKIELVGVSVFLLYLFTQGLHGDRFRQQRILRKVAESGSSHGTKSQDTYYMLLCFLSQRLKGSVWPESEHFLQIPPSCRPQIT